MDLQQNDIRIPSALINDENKFLEERIEEKIKEITWIYNNIDEHKDRIPMLENHQKMIEDELEVIQRLLAACQTEGTTERSSHTSEMKRYERLMINLDNDLNRFTKRKNDFQTEINQMHIQISTMNESTLTDKKTFEDLIDMINKRDEEVFCLMRYTRQDDIRVKELTAELERYTVRSINLKRTTEDELIEYSISEIELDKIAEQFRRAYHQRQQLIKRWETILEQMQRKDYDIDSFAMELVQIKRQTRTKEQELNERKIFYEREKKNNIVLEKLIDVSNQKVTKLKAKEQKDDERKEDSQILSIKAMLLNTQNQFQRERAATNQLKTDIIIKHQTLTKLKQRREQILDRKNSILNEKYSLDEKLSKFEKLFKNEQKYQNNLNSQHKKSSEKLLVLNNELLSMRKREREYEIEHQAYRNQLHNIKNQINKFDQQLLKQQELIYHQDFIKQTIDRRLNRMITERTNEKYAESDIRIRQLKTEYEKKRTQYNQLQNQMKILHEELRVTKHDFERLIEEKNEYKNKFMQFDLYVTLSEKMIKKINIEKEDYLVEENLLNIELKRLKNFLHNSNQITFNLEQQKIDIQKAIKERRMEIQANTHLFRIRFHEEQTKKATISTELAMRISKIKKLKDRYETVNTNEENVRAQAQHVIKSALMKEDLLRQGDQLEALVMKAETELRALENTVRILKWNNIDLKNKFEKLNESSSEIVEMRELEEHLRSIIEQVKIRRRLLKDYTERENSVNIIDKSEIEEMNKLIENKRYIQSKLEDDIEQYHIKINRADQSIKRVQQSEPDVDVRLLRETNNKLEQQLVSTCLATGDQTVVDTLKQLFADQGLELNLPPSKSSSHSSQISKRSH